MTCEELQKLVSTEKCSANTKLHGWNYNGFIPGCDSFKDKSDRGPLEALRSGIAFSCKNCKNYKQ